jgi:hypothetical protein
MARRGRPKKSEELTVATPVDHAKLLKQFEQEQRVQLETFYKELAAIKKKVDLALTHVGNMREVDLFSEAIFKAGRAYGPLDEANDKLEEMLEEIYGNHDFDHWDD